MKVEDVYQDSDGNWHIDYGFSHLMGLAIRVYFGQFFLALTIGLIAITSVAILSALAGFAFGKSLSETENNSSSLNLQQEFIERWRTE
ncbi:MAG: hypothetical protein QNJ72_00415 [Pleurocapsa sp. MO_226.B13]|nr:hypothetical protein [Pleurocapsa sp. MO_226.B13]